MASRCCKGARGVTHCTHKVSQRCRERIIARFSFTSTVWFSFMSRDGARAMLARALGESAPATVRTPAFTLIRLKRTTRADDVDVWQHVVPL
jgi:hypothetical protein